VTRRERYDVDDPIAIELERAFEAARQRVPDEMTVRRSWSTLAARLSTTRLTRRWTYFAGGMATTATLAATCAVWLWPRTIAMPDRPGTATRVGSDVVMAAAETELRTLTLEGGVVARVRASSVMRLEGSDPRVEQGEVRFSVPHRTPGHPFVVRADRFRVIVIGTKFGVAVRPANDLTQNPRTGSEPPTLSAGVDVDVDEGVVEVWDDVRLARLQPGERWHGAVTTAPAPVAVPPATEIAPEPVRNAAPARRTGRTTRTVAMTASSGAGPISRPGATDAAPAELPAAARAALAAGDPARALQIYRSVAQKTGPAAENAAYEIGKVLNERMGQPAGAVAAWRRYRSDYPDGMLRVEADVSIVETLARSGETDDALTEAVDFLRRHPDSERRAEIARLAGDLFRARGDYRRAVATYDKALAASRARDITEAATFHRASCLVRLGDTTGPDAVRAYLRSFPSGKFRNDAQALLTAGGRAQ
jgi:tetratricopeptide (TPR) repeat protein